MNETMVQEVLCGVLACIRHFYYHTSRAFIGISPTSIIYDYKSKQFKLCISFDKKIQLMRQHKETEDLPLVFGTYRKKFWIDLWCVGILMLNCLFGKSLDSINRLIGVSISDLYNVQNIQTIPEKCSQYCCLYHYIEDIVCSSFDSIRVNIKDYKRIYEIEDIETYFVSLSIIKKIPKDLKDLLCNLLHLDLKNPQDFKDILNHKYAQQSTERSKSEDLVKMSTLKDVCLMMRYESIQKNNNHYIFNNVIDCIEQLFTHEVIHIDRSEYANKLKILSKEMNMDRKVIDKYFTKRIYQMEDRVLI